MLKQQNFIHCCVLSMGSYVTTTLTFPMLILMIAFATLSTNYVHKLFKFPSHNHDTIILSVPLFSILENVQKTPTNVRASSSSISNRDIELCCEQCLHQMQTLVTDYLLSVGTLCDLPASFAVSHNLLTLYAETSQK